MCYPSYIYTLKLVSKFRKWGCSASGAQQRNGRAIRNTALLCLLPCRFWCRFGQHSCNRGPHHPRVGGHVLFFCIISNVQNAGTVLTFNFLNLGTFPKFNFSLVYFFIILKGRGHGQLWKNNNLERVAYKIWDYNNFVADAEGIWHLFA